MKHHGSREFDHGLEALIRNATIRHANISTDDCEGNELREGSRRRNQTLLLDVLASSIASAEALRARAKSKKILTEGGDGV